MVLFFNELSLDGFEEEDAESSWRVCVENFERVVKRTLELREDLDICIPQSAIERELAGVSFLAKLRLSLNRTVYGLMLKRFCTIDVSVEAPHFEFSINGKCGVGLSFAYRDLHIARFGCAISLPRSGSSWLNSPLAGDCTRLCESNNIVNEGINLPHISLLTHAEALKHDILDWGATLSNTWKIAEVCGMPVVMYPGPKEHGPPHVHLLEGNGSNRTVAKYQTEIFERAKGPPHWDREMRALIEANRDVLARSWERCQRGEKPILIN